MADRPRGFVPSWRPQEQTRQLLAQVELVLREYAEHLPLTVRQIFYRLVAAYLLEKSERSYGRLCETLVMARRAGAVPFSAIRDDGAPLPTPLGFDSAGDFVDVVRGSARRLHLDRQADLDGYTVVMAEASGMLPQLERVASNFSVPVIGSGGFASVTFAYALAQWAAALGRPVEVLHLGDHDPSGVHIFRSLAADVAAFAGELDAEVKFSRLAVTPEQAVAWNLPTAPAKATDGRSFEGVAGDPRASVQCEAIPPDQLADLVRGALAERIPAHVVAGVEEREAAARLRLGGALDRLAAGF